MFNNKKKKNIKNLPTQTVTYYITYSSGSSGTSPSLPPRTHTAKPKISRLVIPRNLLKLIDFQTHKTFTGAGRN